MANKKMNEIIDILELDDYLSGIIKITKILKGLKTNTNEN